MLTELLIYLAIGSCTGVLAGLFGIGGGTIIVPSLIVTLGWQGVPTGIVTHLAIGTSLAAITMSALSSIHAHHQRKAVQWPLVAWLTPGVCLGVWLGADVASQLSGPVLQRCFASFMILISLQMMFNLQPASSGAGPIPKPLMAGAGSVIGFLSALFGIGGGSLTVPFLNWRGIPMQHAVATAAAVGFPLALVGALGYAWQGQGVSGLPTASTGFIYWPAFAGIAMASIGFARLGAQLAHALDAHRLRRLFAAFMLLIGLWFWIQ